MKTSFDKRFDLKIDKKNGLANLSIKVTDIKVDVYKIRLSELSELVSIYNSAMNSDSEFTD
jgi:hypothetical protein